MRAAISTMLTASVVALAGGAARADVSISNKPTSNMSCSGGVCTATAQKAVLNVGDLQTMLASGDVEVKTGSVAKDIDVDQPLTWTSTSRLTLDAQRSVTVKKQVTVAGSGALTMTTNDGGTDGDLYFFGKGSVTFWDLHSSLVINGDSYTLVGDVQTLAADIAANPSGLYALANSYDASADGTYTNAPITTSFTGTFEGLGHSIVNLSILTQDIPGVGLFDKIEVGGTVRDLGIQSVSITAAFSQGGGDVGALAAGNNGTVIAAFASGSIQESGSASQSSFGGLIGFSSGTVARSHARTRMNVGGTLNFVGDLIGYLSGSLVGQVSNSYADGKVVVSGQGGQAGGLVGASVGGTIVDSYATGATSATATSGGLVGYNAGTVRESFASGSVSVSGVYWLGHCPAIAGGLVGWNDDGTVTDSYATGFVGGGEACVGGLAGLFYYDNFSPIPLIASYSIGEVSGSNGSEVGGLIGWLTLKEAKASDCYWDTDTSDTQNGVGNKDQAHGISGLTTEQFKSGLPKGFHHRTWREDAGTNNGFPHLRANLPP